MLLDRLYCNCAGANCYTSVEPAALCDRTTSQSQPKSLVLIVSDGGAARIIFDSERVEIAKIWLDKLRESVGYLALLNPMPNQSWQNKTAGDIANFVPMFEMSCQGMNGAIRVLRGGYDDSRVRI
jgi:uncharacterized protein